MSMRNPLRPGHELAYAVFAEDTAFVAQCLDVDVASDGKTREAAIANLQEALELYFESPGQRS